ncbi:MAG: V-type ATP synthase subunit D [Proteobacteria bacterium]|nr:MAG: V-type ATP synthase subunit D [Pseudomonadota bacterium]QKK10277.1 MAG: V-type ATP synthase subunit D [Pseudomonadota bacterium]
MGRRLNIPPTRSALLAVRRQVAFLEQGHQLLERKKELLTRLVYERLAQYRELRGEARTLLAAAYRWLGISTLRMSSQALGQVAIGLAPALEVEILPRRSLGVEYPSVTARLQPLQPVGLLGTDPSLDQTRLDLARAAVVLARLGESETALWRLLEEQRKTQKRVNALRYNIIPRYRATVRYIESVLEEEERNTLFQLKRLKQGSG